MSGAQYRKWRVERGLPARTPNEKTSGQYWREKRIKRVAEMKVAAGCTDCGYDANADALEYDHLPGFEKVAAVSTLLRGGASWERVEAEIAKCEVVCANCHRIRTRARY